MVQFDRYAVFGYPIAHSKSPRIHRLFAAQTHQANFVYSAQEVPADRFIASVDDFFKSGGKGLNCTIPLKQPAWQYARTHSERARLSKAVNTLMLQEDGTVYGDNTDGIGLLNDLTCNLKLRLADQHLLLLGAGGAARGIIAPLLQQQPARLVIANRNHDKAAALAAEFKAYGAITARRFEELQGQRFEIILNATAAGLQGANLPLPDDILTDSACCYDLAYANEPTPFVCWGQQRNANLSVDGLGMLVEQAAEAFYLWRGVRPDSRSVIDTLHRERELVQHDQELDA